MNNNEFISHHGIKGQKWGVEHGPPYPVRRGSNGKPKTTSVVKSRLKAALNNRSEAIKKKKIEKEERLSIAKEKRAAKEAEKHAEEFESLKKKVIRDPKELYKNKDKFTKSEIEDLIREIEFDRKIKDIRDSEIDRGRTRYKSFQGSVQTTANLMLNAKNIYNIAAEVNNALIDSGKLNGTKWTKLGSDDKKNDKDSSESKPSESPKKQNVPNTNIPMSSQKVNDTVSKHGVRAKKWVRKHGSVPMTKVDSALETMNVSGPLSYYSGWL